MNVWGTAFRGKDDCASDGSYVTTKWVMILEVPVIPLGSYRVKFQGISDYSAFTIPFYSRKSWTESYRTQRVSLCRQQVREEYARIVRIVAYVLLGVLVLYGLAMLGGLLIESAVSQNQDLLRSP